MITLPITIRGKYAITEKMIRELAFVLYFTFLFWQTGFAFVLSKIDAKEYSDVFTTILVYIPVVLLLLYHKKLLVPDFFVLLGVLALFLGITFLLHPEYKDAYSRTDYGVWAYVLNPKNGLYAYFFVRLLDDAKEIKKCLKISSFIMYIYFAYCFFTAMEDGYWIDIDSKGEIFKFTYGLTFGYNLLLYLFVFMYDALTEWKPVDIIMSVFGLYMLVDGGSRGAVLCVAIFVVVFVFKKFLTLPKRSKFILGGGVAGIVLLLVIAFLVLRANAEAILSNSDISSRFLTMLLDGTILEGNGRERIWRTAVGMIKEHPLLGYGAMGSRHVLMHVHYVGHPHQFFLEMMIDYGVILGILLSLFLLMQACKFLFFKKYDHWFPLFVVFFVRTCHLLLSGTYWNLPSFWGCIAIGVCIYLEKNSFSELNPIPYLKKLKSRKKK